MKKLPQQKVLHRIEIPLNDLYVANSADPAWNLTAVTSEEIANLLNDRSQSLGRASGRGSDIKTATAWQVWIEAGGRCMFEGCGENLANIPLYNKAISEKTYTIV